ncbi:hypothetical protein HPB49_004366 [Dermacentor silvarum]|uniref:Uncharacterized protein n=1 Tax=Dermacentor silvarum TaxID=543639 RepID=A0ACB8D2F5_DERSI|nr:hypothetical protein HPB49_004366 [Dermacentor silvarum]
MIFLHISYFQFSNPETPGYVGFANLPNQVHRKSVKKGFEFTLMVVGESGLGKSTLVNSLFLTDLYPERNVPDASAKVMQTVTLDASTVEIEERGVKLRLTVVDTPGFGDAIDNTDCFKSIIQYIEDQFERFLCDESGLNRRNITDNRVHCCFYFISPFGHGLKPLDIQFMKMLHNKVNIVPVIAKADALTKKEVMNLKRRIMHEIHENGIRLYPLPDCDSDEDEEYKEQVKQLKTVEKRYFSKMSSKQGLSREEIDALLDLSSCDSDDDSEADDWEQLLTDLGTSSSSEEESDDSKPVRANGASTSSGARTPSRTSTARKDITAWIADKDNDYAGKPPDFLVSSSVQLIEVKGRKVRGRLYPWGVVEVENPEHGDFIKLRTMLITHMQDLQEVTQELHYENYRSERLAGKAPPATAKKPTVLASDEKLSEKDRILQEKEAELKRMQEMLKKMQEQMQQGTTNGTEHQTKV